MDQLFCLKKKLAKLLNLLDQEINSGKNLVFRDSKNIINLAGIIGGKLHVILKQRCNS